MPQVDVLLCDPQHILFRDGGNRFAVLLVVGVREVLRPDVRDGGVDPADQGELRGQALHQRLFRGRQLLVGNRPLAGDAAQLLHELDERRVGLAGRHVAASAEWPGTFPEREIRRDAVAVAFVFADVGVQARRSEEHTSELQSLAYLVCRLLLEKKKKYIKHDYLMI